MAGRAEMAAAEAAMGRLAEAAWDARAALTAAGIPGPGAGAEARAWARRVLGAGPRALEPLELLLAELEAPAAPGPAAPAAAGAGVPPGDAPAGLDGVAGAGEVAAEGAGGGPSRGEGQGLDRAWAGLPPELLGAVARAVPAGDRLWFRLVCRSWAAAGAGVAPAAGAKPLPPGKVTRTRMPDAAASVARLEMVLGALEGTPVLVEDNDGNFVDGGDCIISASQISGLRALEVGLCKCAAKNGHLEVLKWARAKGYPWDEQTCAEAAKNGHLEVLQWARANGCPWHPISKASSILNRAN